MRQGINTGSINLIEEACSSLIEAGIEAGSSKVEVRESMKQLS